MAMGEGRQAAGHAPRHRPRVGLRLLLVSVAIVAFGIWASTVPLVRFHWFRLLGDRERAWKEAVWAMPSAQMEHALGELLAEIVEETEPGQLRYHAEVTLACLPHARDRARRIAVERLLSEPLGHLDQLEQLLLEPPGLPAEQVPALAAHIADVSRREQQAATSDGDGQECSLRLAWARPPPTSGAPPPIEVSVFELESGWEFREAGIEVLGRAGAVAAAPLARLVGDPTIGLRHRVRAGWSLLQLEDFRSAVPILREQLEGGSDPGLAVWVLAGLGALGPADLEGLWRVLARRPAEDPAREALVAACAIAAAAGDAPSSEPIVTALVELLREQLEAGPVHRDAAVLLGALGVRAAPTLPDVLALLEADPDRRLDLVPQLAVLLAGGAARSLLALEKSLTGRGIHDRALVRAAQLRIDPGNRMREREFLIALSELMREAGTLEDLSDHAAWSFFTWEYVSALEYCVETVALCEPGPRPELVELLRSSAAEPRDACVLVSRMGHAGRDVTDALRQLIAARHEHAGYAAGALLAVEDTPDLDACRRALEIVDPLACGDADHDIWLSELAKVPVLAPELARFALALESSSLLAKLDAARIPAAIPAEIVDRIESSLAADGSAWAHPDDALHLLELYLACRPLDRQSLIEVLRKTVEDHDLLGARVVAAMGLAELGVPPDTWLPTLLDALRVPSYQELLYPSQREEIVQALRRYRW